MAIKNFDLWTQIESWDLTPEGSDICFERKLAIDNGWTHGFASLVTLEYKRFLYLTKTAGQLVCPSDEVDQAWHQHLTQTVAYQKFCAEVLGAYLHHHASKGGAEEFARHKRMYEFTLQTYINTFGRNPCADIWPDVATRFSQKTRKAIGSVIPRTMLLTRAFLGIASATVIGFTSAHAGFGQSLWDQVPGPTFLACFLMAMCAVALLPTLLMSRKEVRPTDMALDPYEIAYLEGGSARMIGTACAQLIGMGALTLTPELDADRTTIKGAVGVKTQDFDLSKLLNAHYVERTVYASLPEGPTKFDTLNPAGKQKMQWFCDETHMRLKNAGISTDRNAITIRRGVAAYLTIILIGVASNRFGYGVSHYHPIGYLGLATLACWAMLATFVKTGVGLTDLGARVISMLKKEHALLRVEAASKSNRTKRDINNLGTILALGFALFGTQAVMASKDFAGVNFMLDDPQKNNTGNSAGAGGCGGGGCGGGCGGCGG